MHKTSKGYYVTLDDILRCYTCHEFSYFDEEDQEAIAKEYLDHDNQKEREDALEILQEIASDSVAEYVGLLAQGKTTETGEYLLKKFTKCKWLEDKVNFDIDMIDLSPDYSEE